MLCYSPKKEVPMAIEQGRQAYVAGLPITACPHPMGSICSIEWLTAWVQEEEESEESILALIRERGRLAR